MPQGLILEESKESLVEHAQVRERDNKINDQAWRGQKDRMMGGLEHEVDLPFQYK